MKEKILELRKNGLSINEIVEELKCAKSTVSYHINKNGLGGIRNRFLKGVSDETINKIKIFRLESKTYNEILELIDISEDKLKKICRLFEINNSTGGFKLKDVDKDEVIKYYLSVKSIRKTADYFNISRDTVKKYIPDNLILIKDKITKSQSVINWRKRTKIKLIDYKGGCCEKCGYNKSTSALQFHHLNPKEKDFQIGGSSYSFENLKKEVDKCILVCANCHIEIHEELRICSSEAEHSFVKRQVEIS